MIPSFPAIGKGKRLAESLSLRLGSDQHAGEHGYHGNIHEAWAGRKVGLRSESALHVLLSF